MPSALVLSWSRKAKHVANARGEAPVVWLCEAAAIQIHDEAARWRWRETGGILLGYRVARQVVVEATIGPGPSARHSILTFTPDGTWQQEELVRRYVEGGRMQTYLGDWHSHPLGGLRPSGRDLKTARKVATTQEALTVEPLTLIVARARRRWRAGAWMLIEGRLDRATVHPLNVGDGHMRGYARELLAESQ